MIKGVQTIDKRPLLTIEDIQNYVIGLEIENKKLQQQLDKYKNVIDKIKKYIKKELSQGGPKEIEDLVNGDYILELFEEVDK